MIGEDIPEMLEKILEGKILPPTAYNPRTGSLPADTVRVGAKTFPGPPSSPLRHCPGGRIPDSLAAVAMKALALRCQPGNKLAQENLAICQAFLHDEAGRKVYQQVSLNKIQDAITRQGRVAEVSTFAKCMEQYATNRDHID